MSAAEILHGLLTWTPFLAAGFAWNIIIAFTAMAIGSGIGGGLAVMRTSPRIVFVRIGGIVTEFMRNTPTIVCQFYLIFMLPVELSVPYSKWTLQFPAWVKAALALSTAVAGFVSDNLSSALKDARCGNRVKLMQFLPNWSGYFVVIVIASSGASVVGIDELISRCNTVVNATGKTQMMLWLYLYAMLCFFLFCYSSTKVIKQLGFYIEGRYGNPTFGKDAYNEAEGCGSVDAEIFK